MNDLEYRKILIANKRRVWAEIKNNIKYDGKIIDHDNQSAIESWTKEMGVYGGGMAMLSKAMGCPTLLYSPKVQKEYGFTKKINYEYFNTPYKDIKWENNWCEEFLDFSFLISRNIQYPEYLKNISKRVKDEFEYEHEFRLRENYDILHCSAGEILYFLLVWRIVIELKMKNGDLSLLYNDNLFEINNNTKGIDLFNGFSDCDDEDIFIKKVCEAKEINKDCGVVKCFEKFEKKFQLDKPIDYIYKDIMGENVDKSILELNNYVKYLSKNVDKVFKGNNYTEFSKDIINIFIKITFPALKVKPSLGDIIKKLHEVQRFPLLPYYFMSVFDTEKNLKAHIVFPIWFTFSVETSYGDKQEDNESSVMHSLYTIKPIWENPKYCKNNHNRNCDKEMFKSLEEYFNDFIPIFYSIGVPVIDKEYYGKEYAKNLIVLKNYAVKSAISQVMARNMSHNIGSHVLSRYMDKEDIRKFNLNQYIPLVPFDEKDIESQIAVFNEYLKTRMDFLADIATSDPMVENIVEFRSKLIAGIDKNLILLNRISGVSNIGFSFRFILKKNDQKITSTDAYLSIPNGVIGAHAFYIIVENIIRNIVKHGKIGADNKEIKIVINLSEITSNGFDSFYEVSIYDSLEKPKNEIETIVKSRNETFNMPIIEYDILRSRNLGSIEMAVCAAYLRCLPVSSIEKSEYKLDINLDSGELKNQKRLDNPLLIYAYCQQSENVDSYCLGYKFNFNKPKEILVLDDNNTFQIKKNKGFYSYKELMDSGIKVVSIKDLKPNIVFNYQFLYCHSALLDGFYNSDKLPKRIVHNNEEEHFESIEDFKRKVWVKYVCSKEKWRGRYCIVNGNRNVSIDIDEHQISELQKCDVVDCHQVYIDNHYALYQEYHDKIFDTKYYYYDMAYEGCTIKKNVTNITDFGSNFAKDSSLIKKCEYIEIINTSIVLIDERIQDSIINKEKKYCGQVPYDKYFKNQKIFIPARNDVDLNELDFGDLSEEGSVSYKLKKYIETNKKCDYYIIHLGVIEKTLAQDIVKSTINISTAINNIFDDIPLSKIIVTSGRGTPNNLPSNIAYVPIALIQNSIETLSDKMLLTKIVYGSRTK